MSHTILDPADARLADGLAPLVFAGGESFSARGSRRVVAGRTGDGAWACEVVRQLEPGERALVATSFSPDGPAIGHLLRPRPLPMPGRPHVASHSHDVRAVPTPQQYARNVEQALAGIEAGAVRKVVLGRCLDIRSRPPLDPRELTASLLSRRPGRYVFSLPLSDDPQGAWLLGASPELLVRRHGSRIASTPLAGSALRSTDPAEDGARAAALLESAKDLAEHAFVVEHIAAALRPVCVELDVPARPELVATDTMWHLASAIRGRLAEPADLTVLDLARLLHPTPAVGGVPAVPALDLIFDVEGAELRGPMGGFLGWVDEHGEGEIALAIRSGVLDGDRLRLFAGAGIVAGSDPAAEVEETGAKLATMTRAVGL